MEENLMERLLNDFNGVLAEFNELVENKDIEGVRKVLAEVNRLIQEQNGIVLDDREPQYDHVLHELLSKMTGVIERVEVTRGIDFEPGARLYTNAQVQEMISEVEKELRVQAEKLKVGKDENNEQMIAEAESERQRLLSELTRLKDSLVPNQEYSSLTYIDENLKALQEERARLLDEKRANLAEIDRLSAEQTPSTLVDPANQARIDEINSRIAELEASIPDFEGQINDIKSISISDIIANLRNQTLNRTELEARRAELQEQLRRAGDRVRETRGFDEQYAQARSDYSEIAQQLNDLEAQLVTVESTQNNIDFLESLLPERQEREAVLDPMDYTYMGRLSDEQIIRRLLSEQLHLSEEEINETIGEYSLVQAESGAHDEYDEDQPISMRQLVRTRTVKDDLTVGQAIEALEAQLYDGPVVDHTQEIADIDARIAELDEVISDAENRIEQIQALQIADIISQNQENARLRTELEARRTDLQTQLRDAADRVRETRGFDEQNAQAHADYNALVQQIADVERQLDEISPDESSIEFLESLLPDVQQRDELLEPMDYTYMGRLSDEQIIRRLLSEQLHLSEEEINETIGEYSLVQAESGAHDEYDENQPISMRQLVRTRTVKGQMTVKEASEKMSQEIAELEARRTDLQTQLRAAADRIRETRGFDEQNAQAQADYNALVQQIADLESQIAQIRDRQSKLNDVVGIKKEQDRIDSAKEEQETLRSRREELEQDTSRQENLEVREKINRLKEISGIAALEAQIQQIKDEISKLKEERDSLVPSTGKPGIDNSEKIAALEARNKEIDARIAEIDNEIAQIPGIHIPGSESRDSLDVTAEAQKIGDKIFKTAKIRRELAEREVTRDEFLAFYKAGFDRTIEQQKQLEQDLLQMQEEVKLIIVDKNSDKNYNTQIIEAEKAGNTELLVKLYEQLRQNFIAVGREDQLKEMGIDHEIKTPEDLEKMKQFFGAYKASVNEGRKRIKASIAELKENAQVFQTEIKRIEHEKQTLEIVGESPEELEAKSAARKELRKKLLEASITPEKDLTDEQIELLDSWQEASKRFLDSKSTREYTYIDRDGKEQVLTVDTIAEYEGYKEDIEFLGVPAYKENLEQLSAYEQTQDPYVFGPEVGKAYDEAEAEREGAGAEVLERIMADKKKYIETFNGIPNPHKVKYENWKTAGSTLKGMKPVSRDLPMPTRAKNALENVGRFLGIRVPKFTRLDEHGNEVKDVKGGIATLALDGLVVGAVTASTVAVGPALAVAGYAAKGIVTLGNRIAARVEYSRHKDEIDNNVPVINQADRNAREVARKEYYREQGDNRFVAWAKAKSDKYFTRTRERETEAAIVEGLTSEFNEAEDTRTAALKENLEIARANQDARQSRQRQVAMGANTYNDIVRDPDSVDMEAATAAIARNAALEANKPETGREDVNAGSKAQRRSQYVKAKTPLDKTSDLDEAAFEDATDGPVSAITAEQIYTGRKQHVDRLNKVLTAITAAGLKFGYTAWKDGFTKTDVIHHDAEYREDVVHHDAEYGEVETPVTETRFDTSKTLEELRQNYAGKTAEEYYSVSGGEAGARTEALVDRGITAGWFDNKSQWGTGISDTQGLSAPTLTERLADSNLIGANGMLRQDITVQQLLDAMGCKNPDLSTLDGIYCSVGDKYWVKLSDLMQGMTKDVVVGTTKSTGLIRGAWDETVQTLVKDAWDEEIKTFAPELIGKAIKDGALAGAAIGAADALHEAVQTTYIDGATPGRPEEVTPEAKDSFEAIAKKLQEQANKEKQDRERREKEEREDDGAER